MVLKKGEYMSKGQKKGMVMLFVFLIFIIGSALVI